MIIATTALIGALESGTRQMADAGATFQSACRGGLEANSFGRRLILRFHLKASLDPTLKLHYQPMA